MKSKARSSNQYAIWVIATLFMLMGIAILIIPQVVVGSTLYMLAALLLIAAGMHFWQLYTERTKKGFSKQALLSISIQVLLVLLLAIVLFQYKEIPVFLLLLLVNLSLLADGMIQLIIALQIPTARGRVALSFSGVITTLVAILGFFRFFGNDEKAVGLLIGIKLIAFGLALAFIALKSRKGEFLNIYSDVRDRSWLDKTPGELYAGYFGTGFHLGVYIGNDQVVHFRDDNLVHLTSWDEYLRGRELQHWVYPDIKAAPTDVVIKTAKSMVGKKMKYSLFTNNCEHFAIYCKTGGKERNSRYAQIPGSYETIIEHPIIGTITEMYTRILEWIAYNLGGVFGKRVSFAIRRFSSQVSSRLLQVAESKNDIILTPR